MSAERRVVDTLPVLNQDEFPAIPEILGVKPVSVMDSPFQNMEKEVVLSIVTTVAARTGGWKPVGTDDFVHVMWELHALPFAQNVFNAMWKLAGDGFVEIVRHDDKDYIVPSAQFAENVNQSKLMVR